MQQDKLVWFFWFWGYWLLCQIGGKHCCQMSVRIYCVDKCLPESIVLTNVCQNLLGQKLMGNTVDKCLAESVVSEIDGKYCQQMSVRIYCVRNWRETLLTNVCQNLLFQKLMGNTVDKGLSESIVSEIDRKHCWEMSVRICCVRNWWETLLTNVSENLLFQKLMGNTVDKCPSESVVSEIDRKYCWKMSVRICCVRNWWETLLTNVCQNLFCQKLAGHIVDKCPSESIVSEIDCQKLMGKHCRQMSVRICCVRNWWETLLTNICLSESIVSEIDGKHFWQMSVRLYCVRNWWENTVDKCLSESVVSEIDGKHFWQMSVRICCVRNWWETLLTNVCQNLLCQNLMGNTWQMSVRICCVWCVKN